MLTAELVHKILPMIRNGKYSAVTVLLSMMLFLTFSMMHEFDFLLPASPVATTSLSMLSVPDIVEETGAEDEIEHEDSYVIIPISHDRISRLALLITGLNIARVLTPPPDMA